jgi:16S rRNA processing protein RimM
VRAEAGGGPTEEGTFWVHELVGATVVLVDGTEVGTVAEVESNPASDLLVLDSGPLVPVVFVVDQAPGRLTFDPPEGLLDL